MCALLHNACAYVDKKKCTAILGCVPTMLSCMCYSVVVDTWFPAIVYYNFLKGFRIGGWGTKGLKAPTIGQYVSAWATFPLGSGSIYLILLLG